MLNDNLGFKSSYQRIKEDVPSLGEIETIPFGIKFLDKATGGILPSDLILVGAESGSGKTEFATHIALNAVAAGKTVHFLALEAEENEIELRLKYKILMNEYFNDPDRKKINKKIRYVDWYLGRYGNIFEKYEPKVQEVFSQIGRLNTYYRFGEFTLTHQSQIMNALKDVTDLLIIDHVHYFDLEEENENKSLKQIAKKTRDLALITKIPVILVAHLRKPDKKESQVVPGKEEFHGTSDLYKIATKVITLSSGEMLSPTRAETFMSVAKFRIDGSVRKYAAKTIFDLERNTYMDKFQYGKLVNGRKDIEYFYPGDEGMPDWLLD